jgi:hypothetical protein
MHAVAIPVRPARPERILSEIDEAKTKRTVNEWSQAAARMLVATFFIASAVANMGDSAMSDQFSAIIDTDATLIFNAVVYSMAFAVLIGRYVHIAAITLGLILLISASSDLLAGASNLEAFWKDLAITGALFAMAASKTGASLTRFRARMQKVQPRRVSFENGDGPVTGRPVLHLTENHVARPMGPATFISRRHA